MLTGLFQFGACIGGAVLIGVGFHLPWEAASGIGLLTYAVMPQVR